MMRPLLLLLVLSLAAIPSNNLPGAATAREVRAEKRARQARPKDELLLTASVVEQRYCESGVKQLRLKLRLSYSNAGKRRLIMLKGGTSIFKHLISTDLQAAAAGRHKEVTHLSGFVIFDPALTEEPSPGELYTVLGPGDTYETEKDSIIFVSDETEKPARFLPPGDYHLQVQVSTWPESKELADKLRDRWKDVGFFWTRPVTSAPVPFRVERSISNAPCS